MAEPAIALTDVRFRWKSDLPEVLNIADFRVPAGQRIFLQGASGSGKTTLLNLLGGITSPQSGRIRIADTDLTALGAAARDRLRADRIGFVFQQFNLVPYLSLIENVTLPCRFSSARRSRVALGLEDEARRLLTHMQLDVDVLDGRPVTELSVGQQQRVAAARALIGQPELIIADEPTSSIDADARAAFLELLFDEAKVTGATVLFVSHDSGLRDHFDQTVALSDINHTA